MRIRRTTNFERCYRKAPKDIQATFDKQVSFLLQNLRHPSLRAKKYDETSGIWQAQFLSQSNWLYTLQRSADFQSWANVSSSTPGNATNLFLQDTGPPADEAFYRVKAERP